MTLETAILKNIEKLPESVKKAVFDYTEFLVNLYAEEAPRDIQKLNYPNLQGGFCRLDICEMERLSAKPAPTAKRGGLGIWKGKIWMSDDF